MTALSVRNGAMLAKLSKQKLDPIFASADESRAMLREAIERALDPSTENVNFGEVIRMAQIAATANDKSSSDILKSSKATFLGRDSTEQTENRVTKSWYALLRARK